MELPPALRQAVDRFLEGTPLEQLRAASGRLSNRYRSETRDGSLHLDDVSAVKAYLAARLPATYAAVRASMAYVAEAAPDFAPVSLLDIGAGPGTVLWAAADCWDGLEKATMIEASEAVRSAGQSARRGRGTAGGRLAGRRRNRIAAASRGGGPGDAVLRAGRGSTPDNRTAGRPAVGLDDWPAADRRTRHAGRLVAHSRRPRPLDRSGRAYPRTLPASKALPACCSRLVPLLAPRRALTAAPADQGRRRAVGGREVHLPRSVPHAGARSARRAFLRHPAPARDGSA